MRRLSPVPRLAAAALLAMAACTWSLELHAQSAGAAATPQERPAPGAEPQDEHHEPPPSGLFLRAFGAINWDATDERDVPNSFALGQFALFATSTLSDRVSVLAEIVLESSQSTLVATDLERLQLTFRMNDYFRVSAGRYHTGIGYYNSAFHHGSYFETPIGRPRVFDFEDEGGVLPVHDVGISVGGTVPRTGSALVYLAEVGNGRSWNEAAGDEERPDTNDGKSTTVGAAFRPGRWRGLEIGASYYRDPVPDAALRPVEHRIATAHVVYRTPSIEVLAEWLRLSHRPGEGPAFVNHGGYVQASHAWGKLRPYYRYDRLVIDPATPFIGPAGSYTAHIIGLRVDPGQWVGIKAQYERSNDVRQRGIDSLRTQLVFVF